MYKIQYNFSIFKNKNVKNHCDVKYLSSSIELFCSEYFYNNERGKHSYSYEDNRYTNCCIRMHLIPA